jgi:hypothetical protein
MNYFTWDTIKNEILTAYQTHGDNWVVTLICQRNKVTTIRRKPNSRASDCPPLKDNIQYLLDIQRILADDFWGNLNIEGYDKFITRVWKEEVKKP